jgi:ABC-type Fe3+-hydroxamate transport system substrate-binding protein
MPAAREGRAAGRIRCLVTSAVRPFRAATAAAVVAAWAGGLTHTGVASAYLPLPEACRDDSGDTIRIVSLAPAATVTLDSLGLGACLVGRALDDRNPDVASVPVVGSVLLPDVERVLAARPSMVVVWQHADTRALARTLGPQRVLPLPFERLEHAAAGIREIGRATGRTSGAEALAVRLESRLERVGSAARRRRVAEGRVRVLWAVGYDPPIVAGPGGLADDLLTLAGGINVFADAGAPWLRPSREELIARPADVVVWPRGGDLPPPARVGRASPWRLVGALTSGRVHELDVDLVHEAGPRVAAAAELLFGRLHGGTGLAPPPAVAPPPAARGPPPFNVSPPMLESPSTSGASPS